MRLLVADVQPDGKLIRLAEDRQVTRLGESVFSKGILSEEAIRLTEEVLTRFRTTVDGLGSSAIRVVATSASRDQGELTTIRSAKAHSSCHARQ